MFAISVDARHRFVEMALSGFLTPPDVQVLRDELSRKLDEAGLAPGTFVQLVDLTQFMIQSQEVITAFGDYNDTPRLVPARLAFWTGGPLPRMQARKVAASFPLQMYDTRAEALAWLFEADNGVAAAA